jgi:predicted phage tail component-like protein
MIRESLYFSFAGRKSTDFPIANVSLGSGLYEESLTSIKSIVETSTVNNDTPYFQRVKREPKSFQLRFAFFEPWNEDMIDDIVRWLDVDYYEPLFFSENLDRIYYAMFVDDIKQIHNGLKQGYLNLNVRCNSSVSYSTNKSTNWIQDNFIEIDNLGHKSTLPKIWIEKIGDGDISISNISNNNEEFKFTKLLDKEIIYVDCENEIIKTNIENEWRYDNFNDNYLELVYGKNLLKVNGNAKLKFEYRYKFS